jgi:hypothetical protein
LLDNQPIAEKDKNLEGQATSASRMIENSRYNSIKLQIDQFKFFRMKEKMFDLSLFADPVYLLFVISFFLTSIGFNTPLNLRILYAELVPTTEVESAIYGKRSFLYQLV